MGKRARALILAGDAHAAAGTFASAGKTESGADLDHAFERHHRCSDGPAARTVLPRKLAIVATAQTLARPKQRHGLEQIGLARAIVADQHHGTLIEANARALIIAKVGELQLLDIEPGAGIAGGLAHRLVNGPLAMSAQGRPHTRIGMST